MKAKRRSEWLRRFKLPSVRGCVDGWGPLGLSGWAFGCPDIERRVAIQVEIGNGVFEPFRADLYRADVQRAGFGHSGYCGFLVPRRHLKEKLTGRVLTQGRCLEWADYPKNEAVVVERAAHRSGNLLYRLDAGIDPSRLTGWIANGDRPDERCIVRAETERGVAATVKACLFRPESATPSLDGFHGFSIAVPSDVRYVRLIETTQNMTFFEGRRDRTDAFRPR